MRTINIIIWSAIYSICLAHIVLFVSTYIKHRNKVELLYLIVLLNIFALAMIINLSLVLEKDNFIPILVNGILTLYITVPLWGYFLFDVDKKYFKIIPILAVTKAVIDNIFLRHNILIFFISGIIIYILLAIPIFMKRKKKDEKNSLKRKMQAVTRITAALFAVFMVSLIPLSPLVFKMTKVASLYWAAFTLSYQIPGLLYCINRLTKQDALFGEKGISSLTKRENEVALAICEGLKYSEIAEKLFISLSSVKKHSYSIYRKLGINNNRELMQIFISPPPPLILLPKYADLPLEYTFSCP